MSYPHDHIVRLWLAGTPIQYEKDGVWLTLPAPEVALLALLEVIFGVAWAWLWAGETPSASVLAGGALVLLALVGNELLALRQRAADDVAAVRQPG